MAVYHSAVMCFRTVSHQYLWVMRALEYACGLWLYFKVFLIRERKRKTQLHNTGHGYTR